MEKSAISTITTVIFTISLIDADFFKQSEDILEALFCLSLYATPGKLPRGRIDPQLAREINGVFGSGCLGIRANGCRGFGCTDDFVPLG